MTSHAPSRPDAPVLRTALTGTAATFSGIGLARFAYVPLFPAMVAAGWVTPAEAGLLGAFNLAGYLTGVVGARPVAQRLGTATALNLGMVLAVLAFAGCAWDGGTAWLAVCRGVAGVAGGCLMALAGPAVQGAVPPDRRGTAGGIVITGVGLGVIVGSFAVPLLLRFGVSAAWLGLSALTALLLLSVCRAWPRTPVMPTLKGEVPRAASLYWAYGLSAAGLVPHMVYFGDLVVHHRGLATSYATGTWLLFGLGGLTGPLLGGRVADRWGALAALRIWLLLQAAALALSLVPGIPALAVSAFLGGCSAVGLASVALARSREIAGPVSGSVWVRATAAFAIAQATTGFAFAALFARTGSHVLLFAGGLLLSVAALIPVLPLNRGFAGGAPKTASPKAR